MSLRRLAVKVLHHDTLYSSLSSQLSYYWICSLFSLDLQGVYCYVSVISYNCNIKSVKQYHIQISVIVFLGN